MIAFNKEPGNLHMVSDLITGNEPVHDKHIVCLVQ